MATELTKRDTGSRRDDRTRKGVQVNLDEYLGGLGIDDYEVDGDRVYLAEADWEKVLEDTEHHHWEGLTGFLERGWWWIMREAGK
jgi:hypothetical protein